MKLSFYGGAKRVTGSNYLIETVNNERFVLDCGLFQGSNAEEKMNAEPLPYRSATVDFVILSHAHIDHSGRLPLLVKEGFTGPIYCTYATADLADVMLEDSASIQMSDAKYETRKRKRKGEDPVEPLYDTQDAHDTSKAFKPLVYGQITDLTPHIKVRFRDAGHILGSAIVELWVEENGKTTKLVFSGDLGMKEHMLIRDPEYVSDADFLMLESTYGNSVHEDYQDSLDELMKVIEETTSKGGTVVIPSFAVGRTQELVYEMNRYYEYTHEGQSNPVPIYVDSPLANRATRVFMKNTEVLDQEAIDLIRSGDNIFEFSNLVYTETVEDSKRLNEDRSPKVIISASGMATAGRVRHHLKHTLWDPKNAVIFVGYQAEGSLGRIIQDGVDEVKLFGEWVACKAKVYDMGGFSAHADKPSLMDWVRGFEKMPSKIFLVHGEEREMLPFADALRSEFHVDVEVAQENATVTLNSSGEATMEYLPTSEDERTHLSNQLEQIREMMSEWDGRQVDIENLTENQTLALQRTLNSLNMGLMDLNMLLGE